MEKLEIAAIIAKMNHYEENPKDYLDLDCIDVEGNIAYVPIAPLDEVLGLEALGRGHYSIVMGLDENRVLKINKRPDPVYNSFARYAKDNPSPHLPKVYEIFDLGDDKYAYVLERLSGGREEGCEELCQILHRKINHFSEPHYSEPQALDRFLDPKKFGKMLDDTLIALVNFKKSEPELSRKRWDMHGGNVMVRDGIPVLVDPWC